MLRAGQHHWQPPSLGPSSDVAWLEEAPGDLADLNLNSYELDLLANEVRDIHMERTSSGRTASSSQASTSGQMEKTSVTERAAAAIHRRSSFREVNAQGVLGRGVLAANARKSGFLEAEKHARGPFKLSSLCVGLLGSSLEDLMDEVEVLGKILPQIAKAPLIAIARRRGLLNDKILTAFSDESFEILDASGSLVTDAGIAAVAAACPGLKAVDIRCCPNLTSRSIEAILRHCPEIHTLRLGGDAISNRTAQRSIKHLIPQLQAAEASPSWEELNIDKVAVGAGALDWLIWPSIDEASLVRLEKEFPRVTVNPKKKRDLPYYARIEEPLDGPLVQGMDPASWASRVEHEEKDHAAVQRVTSMPLTPIAERFRLAYVERYERTAAKRAKNKRQQERRAEKDFLMKDLTARARTLASMVH